MCIKFRGKFDKQEETETLGVSLLMSERNFIGQISLTNFIVTKL